MRQFFLVLKKHNVGGLKMMYVEWALLRGTNAVVVESGGSCLTPQYQQV